ncbi:MAG: flagellar basal body P-ring protein FlgI [Tepidisphaeraceae bacterium]
MTLLAAPAFAARIADVTQPSNERTNVVNGMGLVYGLKGTGDGGDFQPAIRMLAAALSKFDNPVTVLDLKSVKNVALVNLQATLPASGTREGDAIDVRITSIGSASSLKGGTLFVCPMQFLAGKDKRIFVGIAAGTVDLDDPTTPTSGVVKHGLVVDEILPAGEIKGESFSFYLDPPSASWALASQVASTINNGYDGQQWATAVSEKEIVVRIPPGEQQYPANFVANLQQLQINPVPAEARVVINQRTGTIICTGDVEISPVVISHKGLTISTVTPEPVPTPRAPVVKSSDVVAIDTNNAGGAKLQDLINALDQLKVPVQDRIDIVKELHKSSRLHAKLIME